MYPINIAKCTPTPRPPKLLLRPVSEKHLLYHLSVTREREQTITYRYNVYKLKNLPLCTHFPVVNPGLSNWLRLGFNVVFCVFMGCERFTSRALNSGYYQ
jgi:hypothetical protein